jgi:hypothetical protein
MSISTSIKFFIKQKAVLLRYDEEFIEKDPFIKSNDFYTKYSE